MTAIDNIPDTEVSTSDPTVTSFNSHEEHMKWEAERQRKKREQSND